jgi:hypothetical protein
VTTRPGAGRETELEHERLQLLLGGFVLGGLDADDHQAFTRHLRHCAACQRESAQLSGLPALLDVVDRDRVIELEPPDGMPGGAGTPGVSTLDGAASRSSSPAGAGGTGWPPRSWRSSRGRSAQG